MEGGITMFEQLSVELLEARGDSTTGNAEAAVPDELISADSFWRTAAELDDEEGAMSQSLLLVLAGLSAEVQQRVLDGLADNGLVVKPAASVSSSATDPASQLVSRIEEELRRVLHRQSVLADTFVVQTEPSAESEPVLKFPLLTIALDSREVFVRGRLVPLSRTEFTLLRLMAKSPGRVFSREDLVVRSRGSNYPVTSRSIDVQIVGIRKKLGQARSYIETIRGAGYRFTVPNKPEPE
jgi:DNA-binding winged helix-turn-helix (wHTH) protein